MSAPKTIFWFRQDLRLIDNPGFCAAAESGVVLPVYIVEEAAAGEYAMGGASRWWLHHALHSLEQELKNTLNFYSGDAFNILLKLAKAYGITEIYTNQCYEPWRIKQEAQLTIQLKEQGIAFYSLEGALLWHPESVLKEDKTPYKVYTPFYRAAITRGPIPRQPLPVPENIQTVAAATSMTLAELKLLPTHHWCQTLAEFWEPDNFSALDRLELFIENSLYGYGSQRDYLDNAALSHLSPALHFGQISSNQVWYAIKAQTRSQDTEQFLRQLIWREFSYYWLYHFPELPHKNFQPKFDVFPWQHNPEWLKAWQQGQTGYPVIDAGMRELWQTGYMHNRVRMLVASFLVKNLMIHWHYGAAWFWDCLCDADLANNSAGWQWVAGSGMDASPYFRIFNPITQGEKFDSEGHYTRYFVPELEKLPEKYLFKPWEAPEEVLKAAGVILGKTYPLPIVDFAASREKALAAYKKIK